jgi:hypothetical protein
MEPFSGYKVFVECRHFIAKTRRREGAKEHVTENEIGKLLGKMAFRMLLEMSDRIQSGARSDVVQRGDSDESAKVIFASLAVLAPLREKRLKGADSILTIKFSKAIGHVEGKWNRTFKWLQGFRWVPSLYRQDAKTRRRKGIYDIE